MAVYRCKMCGGDLSIVEGASYCTCEFCGTQQTIPTVKDEGLQNLFNRANLLRMKSEFDKASEIYEKILQRSATEAEAYWGLILCKYGIEYVEDPTTFKRIPTCHRASYDAVTADEDYKNALKYADTVQRGIYEEQAKEIDQLQKGILNIVHKEKPYDIFICYKETDENGKRTPDSVIANDIYHQLTMEGFKVFYAAITLEDKLGTEYEPYIFSALNTAKVMLAIGTKPEYFNAVWVKNEWSRFLKIMKKDRSRLLIPCYRDMDPYELPEEFAHLQAQDMSKIGFINDIVRGIKKVIVKESAQPKTQEIPVVQTVASGTTASAQVKRGNMALEDHDWNKADGFFEEALNLDPECAEAYLGKLLASDRQPSFAAWLTLQKERFINVSSESLEACPEDTEHVERSVQRYVVQGYLDRDTVQRNYKFDRIYGSSLSARKSQKTKQQSELSSNRMLTRARQYAKGSTKQQIEDGLAEVYQILDERITLAQKQDEKSITRVKEAYEKHLANTDKKIEEMNAEALNSREQRYQDIVASMKLADDVQAYSDVVDALTELDGYKDSNELAAKCRKEINRLNDERQREEERKASVLRMEAEQKAKKQKKTLTLLAAVTAVVIAGVILITKVIIPNNQYNAALALKESGKYEEAIKAFETINGYRRSSEEITDCKYLEAISLMESGEYDEAVSIFNTISDYKDSRERVMEHQYQEGIKLMESAQYQEAVSMFTEIEEYKDSKEKIETCKNEEKETVYKNATELMEAGAYYEARVSFTSIKTYKDSNEKIEECNNLIKEQAYNDALTLKEAGKYTEAIEAFNDLLPFKDSERQIEICKVLPFANAKVRDSLVFGHYNNNDLLWRVLARNGNSVLLLTEETVDERHFQNNQNDPKYYINSPIRTYLNGNFLTYAFSKDEQEIIETHTLHTTGGNVTDKVFLLSEQEANEYFDNDYSRKSKDGKEWFLRTVNNVKLEVLNYSKPIAMYVKYDGKIYQNDSTIDYKRGIRPAMWIDVSRYVEEANR